MATVSCSAKCSSTHTSLEEYIKFYAEKFKRIVNVSINPIYSQSDYDSSTGVLINPLNPLSISYNTTLYELNSIGNRIIPYIGGVTFPESYQQDPDIINGLSENNLDNRYGVNTNITLNTLNSSIVSSVTSIFDTIFTDFTYKNANMTACEAWVEREGEYGIEKSSFYKVKSIGIIDQCKFLDKCKYKLENSISENLSSLELVKSLLTNLVSYINSGIQKISKLGQLIIDLDSFYNRVTTDFSNLSLYSTSCDYVSHQYYTNPDSWITLNNWNSTVGGMIQTIENKVPVLIKNQSEEILSIIDDIRAVREELHDNKSIELLQELDSLVNEQYLSSYIDGYGYKLANIIREIMSGVDKDTYDYHLIDKLTLIEQRLQQSMMNATNRMSVNSVSSGVWGENGYKEANRQRLTVIEAQIRTIETHQESI